MTDPIDTDTNSKPQPEAGKPKGGRKPAKKAQTAKNAAPANKSARKPKADRTNKKAEVIAMMQRAKGATLDEIAKATGWQRHTVRGFVSILGNSSTVILAQGFVVGTRACPFGMTEITPLHLSREWTRLLKCGGHTRKSKTPRAMKPKTVRNIAGLVSSAFVRAIKWGLAATNPVTHSDLPKVRKRIGMALLPSEQDRLTQCATGPWCLPVFLDVAAATGARRGEILALRLSDINGMIVLIERSLCQTRDGLLFKSTKTEEPRKVELPPSTVACLDAHRLRQDEFRRQFGPDYRSDLDLIFANPDGSPLMPNSISSTVSRLCRRLGLPKGASLHVLRHSHASLMLADGVDIATVSARLGHSSVRTTADIYSHAIRGKDHAAAQCWDDIMQRARSETEKSKTVN